MAATSTPSVRELSQQLLDIEVAGLNGIKAAIDAFITKLEAVDATLDFAENYKSDAKRIIGDLRGQMQYRTGTELPQLINVLVPPEPPAPPVEPTP